MEKRIDSLADEILEGHQRQLKSPTAKAAQLRLQKITTLCKQLSKHFSEMSKWESDALRYHSDILASKDLWDPELDENGKVTLLRWKERENTKRHVGPKYCLSEIFRFGIYSDGLINEFISVVSKTETDIVSQIGVSGGQGNLLERYITSVGRVIHIAGYLLHWAGRTNEINGTKTKGPLMAVSAAFWTYATDLEEPSTLGNQVTKLAPGLKKRLSEGQLFGPQTKRKQRSPT